MNIFPGGHNIATPKKKTTTQISNQRFQNTSRSSTKSTNSSSTISVFKPAPLKHSKQEKSHSSKSSSTSSSSRSSGSSGSKNLEISAKKDASSFSSSSSSDVDANKNVSYASGHTHKKKIGCMCPPCLEWNVKDIENDEEEFLDTQERIPKPIVKPALLLKQAENEDKVEIKTLSSTSTFLSAKRSKVKDPAILVHG